MQNSCWKACSKTKHQKNHIVCIVSKDVQKEYLTLAYIDYFQRKLLLQTESCTVQSVEVYSKSSFIAFYSQKAHAFKILISKCRRFSACASWFTKDWEGHKIYWANSNRVLDTFSLIRYMTVSCLCHASNLLHRCTVARLHRCTVAPLHRCTVAPLHRCTVAPMHGCTVAQLHRCTDAPLHSCTVAPLHRCTDASMHRCTLHRCTVTRLHRCTVARTVARMHCGNVAPLYNLAING